MSQATRSNDSRAETQHTPFMGIRIHQSDLTSFLRPESLLPSYAAETCVESKPTNMDAHSNNSASTAGSVLYLRTRSSLCRRNWRFHRRCHLDQAVARRPVDSACDCAQWRWTELSHPTKSEMGRRRSFSIHRHLLGHALDLADLRGAQEYWIRPRQDIEFSQRQLGYQCSRV